jgi:hypothetical protein
MRIIIIVVCFSFAHCFFFAHCSLLIASSLLIAHCSLRIHCLFGNFHILVAGRREEEKGKGFGQTWPHCHFQVFLPVICKRNRREVTVPVSS